MLRQSLVRSSLSIPYTIRTTERFFWKPRVHRLLSDLRALGASPTAKTSESWTAGGFHEPMSDRLRQQLALEYACCKDIINDPELYKVSQSAEEQLHSSLLNGNNGGDIHDLLRFRARTGVALPSELAVGLQIGCVAHDDIRDEEAAQLVKHLSSGLRVAGNSMLDCLSNEFSGFSSALAAASGIPMYVGQNASEWEQVRSHCELGNNCEFDLTRCMTVPAPFIACGASGGTNFVHPALADEAFLSGTKQPRIMFIDLESLDRSESLVSPDSTETEYGAFNSFVSPQQCPYYKLDYMFGLRRAAAESSNSDSAIQMSVLQSCVPKVTAFCVADACSLVSSRGLHMLQRQIDLSRSSEQPLLCVVLSSAQYQRQGLGELAKTTSNLTGQKYDWRVVLELELAGLTVAGFSNLSGASGAASWLDDVVHHYYGARQQTLMTMKEVRCVAVPAPSTVFTWAEKFPDSASSFHTTSHYCPKCLFTEPATAPAMSSIASSAIRFTETGSLLVAAANSAAKMLAAENAGWVDACPLVECAAFGDSFWNGVQTPTKRSDFSSQQHAKKYPFAATTTF